MITGLINYEMNHLPNVTIHFKTQIEKARGL